MPLTLSKSRLTVDARRDVGDAEFSIVVDSTQPVVAERVMYFVYNGAIAGGHDVLGATVPGKEVFFAEGTAIQGFDEWVCIMNPNNDPVHVTWGARSRQRRRRWRAGRRSCWVHALMRLSVPSGATRSFTTNAPRAARGIPGRHRQMNTPCHRWSSSMLPEDSLSRKRSLWSSSRL